jgi:hypothetical protein
VDELAQIWGANGLGAVRRRSLLWVPCCGFNHIVDAVRRVSAGILGLGSFSFADAGSRLSEWRPILEHHGRRPSFLSMAVITRANDAPFFVSFSLSLTLPRSRRAKLSYPTYLLDIQIVKCSASSPPTLPTRAAHCGEPLCTVCVCVCVCEQERLAWMRACVRCTFP